MPTPTPVVPYQLPSAVLDPETGIRKTYEEEKGIKDLDTHKRSWYTPKCLGGIDIKNRRVQIHLVEEIAKMVYIRRGEGDKAPITFDSNASRLLFISLMLMRKQIEQTYTISRKEGSYGKLHTLIGKQLGLEAGNQVEKETWLSCLAFLKHQNQQFYNGATDGRKELAETYKISDATWTLVQTLAAQEKMRIERNEKLPGPCEKVLGFSGYPCAAIGWGIGYFGGFAVSCSKFGQPLVSATTSLFDLMFRGSSRMSGGGDGYMSSALLAGTCARETVGMGLGYAGGSLGAAGGYAIGRGAGGLLGKLLDATGSGTYKICAAMLSALKSQPNLPIRYGYDLETGAFTCTDLKGEPVDITQLLDGTEIESLMKSGNHDKDLSPEEQSIAKQFGEQFEALRPQIQAQLEAAEAERQRQAELEAEQGAVLAK